MFFCRYFLQDSLCAGRLYHKQNKNQGFSKNGYFYIYPAMIRNRFNM